MRIFCVLVGILLVTFSAHAQDAAWLSNPGSNNLSVGSNWSTGTVPTGIASFGVSNTTTLISSGFGQSFGGWTFAIGASAYSIALTPNSGNVGTEFVGAGIVVDGGSVSITNPGLHNALYFLNSSSAGGAQITNSGSLLFSNSSSAGTASITNNVETWFSNNSTADHATIVNSSGGGLFFEGSSTAGNATITNNSISGAFPGVCFDCAPVPGLQFAGTSTAGNATIITNGGTTQFVDQSTGGNARFIAISGSVDFSNALGPNGDGKVSAGSIEGSGNYFLGSRELTVGSNNLSTQVSGTINDGGACIGPSGPCLGGSLVKVGTGTLTLSGIETYSGTTTINDGTLSVNGSIASSSMTIVNAAAILTGTGIVGSTSVNGGSFSPGNGTPGSSITVNGSLAFTSGALYAVALSRSTASSATVTGTATLGGATVNAFFSDGSYIRKQYTILSAAGGVRGTFLSSTESTNLPPGFVTTLSYSATSVFLNLVPVLGGGGLNGNQRAPIGGINNFFNSGGMLPPGFLNLFALSGAGLANALTQISGETAVGSQQTTFDAMGQFMGLLTDPFMDRSGGFGSPSPSSGYAWENVYGARSNPTDAFAMFTKAPLQTFEQRWGVWASGFGGSQSTSGNTVVGSNNTASSIAGTAVGADYLFSPNTLAGFALAGGGTSFSVANGGTGRSDLFQMGVYVRHNEGPAYISAALAYGWQDITNNRPVTVSGLDQLRAEFNANAWSGRLEGGYRFVSPLTGGVGITPYAAAQFVTFDLPAYAEQAIVGSNNFALSYNAKDVTDTRTELGVRTDKSWLVGDDGILTLRGRFAWAHDYDPDRSIAATFQTLPGASFIVNGAAQAADSALTTASIEMKWRSGWSAAATLEGEFFNVTSSYAGKGVVRYQW